MPVQAQRPTGKRSAATRLWLRRCTASDQNERGDAMKEDWPSPVLPDRTAAPVGQGGAARDPGARWPADRHPLLLETSQPGAFAAGDVRHRAVKRVASAVRYGAITIPLVHRYLEGIAVPQAAAR